MNEIKVKGIYKHFKGDLYLVEDIGIDSETNKEVVIYRGLYENTQLYVRELEIFISKVDKIKYPDVKQEYRFELQNISSVKNK